MYSVLDLIDNMSEEYGMHAVHVFIHAEPGYKCMQSGDIATFVDHMFHCGHSAKFYRWHDGVAGAMRTFCNICLVDPGLIETYLGLRMEEVATHIL